jgi:hypothetical protein
MCAALFGEFLFELAVAALVDLVLCRAAGVFETLRFANHAFSSLVYTVLGASTGGLTLFIFPHSLMRPSKFGFWLWICFALGDTFSRSARTIPFSVNSACFYCLQRRARELKIFR